ncbi:PHD finger-like domain-containing protein 5B [Sphaceloma murrayae]|uniref:PHD finger-like domain-containing protein 5B n=1 Tax=Sphaceloma murrayae TaxID=2082308 RepID=A0A2K1QYH8_9PEZI|nr:PHD finger-like domain-containing protein 5B [Sphaceloma murrayae]
MNDGSSHSDQRIDALLRRLDPSILGEEDLNDVQPSEDSEGHRRTHGGTTGGHPQLSTASTRPKGVRQTAESCSFGPTSGHSIICRLSLAFEICDDSESDKRSLRLAESVTELLRPSDSAVQHHDPGVGIILPSQSEFRELYRACFEEHIILYQVITETELESVLQNSSPGTGAVATALLHSIAALGFACGRHRHSELGCDHNIYLAKAHAQAARSKLDLPRCEGILSLQSILCLVLYFLSRSNITLAYSYSTLACNWLLQLGLHRESLRGSPNTSLPEHRRKEIVIVALKLQVYLTLTLDLPLALQRKQIDSEMWASVQSRFDSDPSENVDRSSPSSCHFLLLEVTKEGLEKTFTKSTNDMTISNEEAQDHIDLSKLGSVEARLQELIERAFNSTARIADPRQAKATKLDLEMTTYSCQLMLYMPFLHYVERMAKGMPTSRTRSQRVLTCIKVASKTITFCDNQLRHKTLEPSSWFQTYTLFLAVLTLMFLIAAHRGTTHPSEAWKKGEQGIRILAAMRCHDNGASKCLKVIRALIDQLSHTVEFDIDAIERTTPTLCEACGDRTSTTPSASVFGQSPATRDARMMVSNVVQLQHGGKSAADIMLAEANDFVLFGNNYGFGG